MALINSGFHIRKNFSENYPQFGHAPQKISTQSYLKKIGFKGRQIVSLPGAPNH
jgi:hypothetical protein